MVKKVLFITTPSFPVPATKGGAIEQLVTAIINQNEKKKELDITVYTIFEKKAYRSSKNYSKVKFVFFKKNIFSSFLFFLNKALRFITHYRFEYKTPYMSKLNRYLARKKFDYIVFESSHVEVMQLKASNAKGAVVMYHIHADYLNKNLKWIDKVINNVNIFVGVSNYISKSLMTNLGLPLKRVVSLLNAVDINEFDDINKAEVRTEVRKELGIDFHEIVFVYCGRLSREKGCLELVKAFQNVASKCTLLVVGGENFSSNRINDYVKNVMEESKKCLNKVIFTGFVPNNLIKRYLFASDIGIVPSVCNEAASLSLVEFRAAGLATIATKIGGIPEFASENGTILVDFNKNFNASLSNTMNMLLSDHQKMLLLSRESKVALDNFSYDNYYERFLKMLKNY